MGAYRRPELVPQDEVEELLEAYADARLAPTGPVLARMRAAVMLEAASFAATRAAEARHVARAGEPPVRAGEPQVRPSRRLGFPRLTLAAVARPAFALGFAGMLAIGTGAAVTAAPPGSAFYNTRVALEAIFLPSQIDARLASHVQHLDERLAEADAAAARGDAAALAAALAAYQAEMDQAIGDVGNDFSRLEHFQAVLEKHVAKLTALSLRLPTEVSRDNAVEHAIQAGEKAVTKVKEKKAHADNRPSTPPGQNNPPKAPNPPNPPGPPDPPGPGDAPPPGRP